MWYINVSFVVWFVFKVPYTLLYLHLMACSFMLLRKFVKMMQTEQGLRIRHWLIIGSFVTTIIWFVVYTIGEFLLIVAQGSYVFFENWYMSSFFTTDAYLKGVGTIIYYLEDIQPFILLTLVIT